MISVMLSSLEKRRWIIIVKIIILSPPILPPIYPYHFWLHFPPSPKSCWENQNVKLYNFDYLTYILTPQFFVLLHDLNDCMRRFTKDKKVCAGQCCWNKKTLYSLKGCVILHSYLQHKWIVYTSILLSALVSQLLWFLSSFINRLSINKFFAKMEQILNNPGLQHIAEKNLWQFGVRIFGDLSRNQPIIQTNIGLSNGQTNVFVEKI